MIYEFSGLRARTERATSKRGVGTHDQTIVDDNHLANLTLFAFSGPLHGLDDRAAIFTLSNKVTNSVDGKRLFCSSCPERQRLLLCLPKIDMSQRITTHLGKHKISTPRNIQIFSSGRYSLHLQWDVPECGNIVQYEYVLNGQDEWAQFDVHRGVASTEQITVQNLLPGTRYIVVVRGVDKSGRKGPWLEETIEATTDGKAPTVSQDIQVVFKSDSEMRIKWKPVLHYPVQHYEVLLSEQTNQFEALHVLRAQVPADENSFLFRDLKAMTSYNIGVIAFVNHEPRVIYHISPETSGRRVQHWRLPANAYAREVGKFSVHWSKPADLINQNIKGFYIEYRLKNETG
ncbi:unnamed protein product [Soboliphyme baturini]|uniref:Fibronectin type-III domain-containing protein n=1 Tax=Soboliphyme baturini TaxID=241478 RepID=A0A183IB97_9BILA|nr:unnamed protein product [Soboliphyme baturini]